MCEAVRYIQVLQFITFSRSPYPQHLAALRRDTPGDEQRALHLSADHASNSREVTGNEAQGVNDVAVGDGQCVRALADIPLPGVAGRTLHRTTTHCGHLTRQHLAHVVVLDQILDIQQCGTRSRLQTHGGLHALARVSSASSSASIVFFPRGHSVKTCLPASMAALVGSQCDGDPYNHGVESVPDSL